MANSKKWTRGVIAIVVTVLFLGTTVALFGLRRLAAGAATLTGWKQQASKQGLALDFGELIPSDQKGNGAKDYATGNYANAARKPMCWFDIADPSAREFVEFEPLKDAFADLMKSDLDAALKVLNHASAVPFREAYVIRLQSEKQLLSTASKGEKSDLIRTLGPLPHPRTALRGELARDRMRLERKWKNNAPFDFLMAKDVAEARLIELWSAKYDEISMAKTPEEVEAALVALDDAIEGRRVIGRFMRTGYREVGKLYREVAQLRDSP